IAHIHKNSDMRLECFVHGAMCVSFSGGCLFSSLVGGRSGNRGECAQPCRKKISISGVPKVSDYNLSIADMCMIEHINELKAAGVSSLKIEGRMKKPEYVAIATYAYRRAIDGADPQEVRILKQELNEVFSRGEFSCGYYFGADFNRNAIAKAQPSKELQKRLQESFRKEKPIIPIKFTLLLKENEQAVLKASARCENIEVLGKVCERAKVEIDSDTEAKYENQLKKLGDTPYYCEKANVIINNAYLPISAINEMRRKAIEIIEEKAKIRRSAGEIDVSIQKRESAENVPLISARVIDFSSAIAAFNAGADEVTIDALAYDKNDIEKLFAQKPKDKRINIALPIAILGEKHEKALYGLINSYPFDAIEVNNLGQIEALRNKKLIGGTHLNALNSHTINALLNLGLRSITLSPELNKKQCKDLALYFDCLRVEVYGRATLMNLFSCPIRSEKGCKSCELSEFMTDEQQRKFPILKAKNSSPCAMIRLMNCFAMDNVAQSNSLKPYSFVLSFYDDNVEVIKNRITALQNVLCGLTVLPLENTTRGYWNR
ncbi:MAG: U32 family peptidase, partial [Clostridiales bacterium]|nr:U32 family peptidase [Clostridiales bacterium]